DFWGRFRRDIEAANADLDASVADYDAAVVTLLGDIAANYVEYRTLEKRIDLAKANVVILRGTFEVAEAREQAGRTTDLDVKQAKANLNRTEAIIPTLEILQQQASNRLCLLLGIPPRKLDDLLKPGRLPTAPPDVIVGIPADLLRRRPD